MNLTIIIVDYLNAKDTIATIRSILKEPDSEKVEIIIVDNSPYEQEMYAEISRYTNVKILYRKDNPGFGTANNYAVSTIQKGEGFLWFLNNDTLLDVGSLEKITRLLENGKERTIYGTYIVGFDGRLQAVGGGKLFTSLGITRNIKKKEAKLDYIHGASFIVPLDGFRTVGGFDEKIFMYFEDVDLSLRFIDSGYAIKVIDVVVYHREGGSIGKTSDLLDKVYTQSSRYFFEKNVSNYLIPIALGNLGRFVKRLSRGNLRGGFTILREFTKDKIRCNAILISGHNTHKDKDAVGDYTNILAKFLGINHLCIEGSLIDWVNSLREIYRNHSIVHIQYPSEGWGTSVKPGLIPPLVKIFFPATRLFLTLHEWKSMHILRKASIILLLLASENIIFVDTIQEKSFNDNLLLKTIFRGRTSVIPIGVNLKTITVSEDEVRSFRESLGNPSMIISYFGFLYDSKQPHKMLDTIRSLVDRGIDVILVLAGDYQSDHQKERNFLMEKIESLNLAGRIIFLGYVEDETFLSKVIKSSDLMLALYEDGLSARRSSFWYGANIGVPIVSTTPKDELDEITEKKVDYMIKSNNLILVDSKATGKEIAEKIIRKKLDHRKSGKMSIDWEDIVVLHRDLYE